MLSNVDRLGERFWVRGVGLLTYGDAARWGVGEAAGWWTSVSRVGFRGSGGAGVGVPCPVLPVPDGVWSGRGGADLPSLRYRERGSASVKSSLRVAGRRALLGLGAGVAALVVAAAPALAADVVIQVKDAQVPTRAVSFDTGEDCAAAGPARPGFDAWHLVLPGNDYVFTEVTGLFAATKDGPVVFTAVAPGPYGVLPVSGQSTGMHAYLFAPAGLWLIDATAKISGEGTPPADFNISHACPGVAGTPSPSTSPTTSPSTSVSPSTSTSPSSSLSPEPSTSLSGSSSPQPSTSAVGADASPATSVDAAANSGGGLPTTGAALTGILGAGVLLLVGGVALVVFARRRRAAEAGGTQAG